MVRIEVMDCQTVCNLLIFKCKFDVIVGAMINFCIILNCYILMDKDGHSTLSQVEEENRKILVMNKNG